MRIAIVGLLVACSGPRQDPQGLGADAGDGGGEHDHGSLPDAATSTTACTGKTAQPLDATWTIDVGGTQRKARVHIPASYDPEVPTAVVINIHGRTSTAAQQAFLSHAHAKADASDFVVIHPESSTSPTSWNAGTCCDPATANNVDDAGFMRALLDEAEARLCVDLDRVFAMGLSNGGYMAHRMACELGDRIAAIGPVAGLLQYPGCQPARAVPVLLVHGTDDTLVSYSWVDETIDFWRMRNTCTSMQTTYQNGAATCVTHGDCTGGADVVLCTIEGGGHQWPGGEAIPFLGTKSDDLIATDHIWDFFAAHPR